MGGEIKSSRQGKLLLLSFFSFTVVGYIAAYFVGIGWLFLITTLRRLFFTDLVPSIYVKTISIIVGKDYAERERSRIRNSRKDSAYAVETLLLCILSILVIWKINFSFSEIINTFFR
jgi:hypothetical protein